MEEDIRKIKTLAYLSWLGICFLIGHTIAVIIK
jgi:hypothetical protein